MFPKMKHNVWGVAGLQFITPMGTWRVACEHGTHPLVQFRPLNVGAAYRGTAAATETMESL
jgi:hypothetical protein